MKKIIDFFFFLNNCKKKRENDHANGDRATRKRSRKRRPRCGIQRARRRCHFFKRGQQKNGEKSGKKKDVLLVSTLCPFAAQKG